MRVVVGSRSPLAVCRLVHYRVGDDDAVRPIGTGMMTQVADLLPLPPDMGFLTGTMAPLLAEALRLMAQRHPETANRPVWAVIPEALVDLMARFFFTRARTSGRYIWMPRLSQAARDVSALARPFPDMERADVDAVLPLYRDAYSQQLERDELEGELFRGSP